MNDEVKRVSRRIVLQAGAMAGIGFSLPGLTGAAAAESFRVERILRPIPSTGEKVPVIGVGTNRFGGTGIETVKDVLGTMYGLGGRVIDTAAMYSGSEEVIGEALSELGRRDKMFVATKFNAAGAQFSGPARAPRADDLTATESFERSLEWLGMDSIDLLFAHFLSSVEPLMPQMLDLKQQGRTRYIGITSVQRTQHPRIMQYMQEYPIDFLQIDYSIDNRDSATDVLPLAAELGIAVMVAVPFGGGHNSLFARIGDRTVPDWAAEFDVTSWGQFFLKYIVSHPAVTCVIPGTTNVNHMKDNQGAGVGALPDKATRRRMEEFWDSIK